jgi:hypothetical protein
MLGRPLLTFVDRQISLLFAQDIVLLLLFHVRALEVGLVKHELVWARPAGEGIAALRISR